ncbi:glycosyltransferase family 39 protein [Paenibacillus yanchengensis]|uniref:Glycosyltransferase family 39 protein n=1 Tax=Paenibacillus yanchengensis TaxID=2035833 RepID=A0ABW4YRA5_9BACL
MRNKDVGAKWWTSLIFIMIASLFIFLPNTAYASNTENSDTNASNDETAASIAVQNNSFEEGETGWQRVDWLQDGESTTFQIDAAQAVTGNASLFIHNVADNHARYVQTISVEENKLYRIRAQIKAEGFKVGQAGAHIQIEGVAAYYPDVHDTFGQWQMVDMYVQTAKDQQQMTIGLSAGGYSSNNAGKAWFDDVAVEQVTIVPDGYSVYQALAAETNTASDSEQQPVHISLWSILLFAALFAFLMYGFVVLKFRMEGQQLLSEQSLTSKQTLLHIPYVVWSLVFVGLILRVIVTIFQPGYANDIGLFQHWAKLASELGLPGLYATDNFIDYPPGYIYVLYVLGKLHQWLQISYADPFSILLFKLPIILADALTALVIFRIANLKLHTTYASLLAIIYLFNPLVITNSAAWGQIDAIYALILVLSIQAMIQHKTVALSILFAIAALIKPQTFIFTPVLLLYLTHRKDIKQWLISAVVGFTTFLIPTLPFFLGHGGIPALIKLYSSTLSSYPYASLNAYNIYTLFGANWLSNDVTFLGSKLSTWGTLGIFTAVIIALYYALAPATQTADKRFIDASHIKRSFFIAMVLIAVVFLFVTKMHERYMFPFLLLTIFAYIESQDRRLLHIFFGFTITNYVNVSIVLAYSKFTAQVPTEGIAIIGSLVNLVLFGYMLYVGYDLYIRGNVKKWELSREQAEQDRQLLTTIKDDTTEQVKAKRRIGRKDIIIMTVITVVYATVAFINLGATKGPVTVWQPKSSGQSFYIDLGDIKEIDRITSFGGVGTGAYQLAFSNNGTDWSYEMEVEQDHVAVFAWNTQKIQLTAQYVKVTTQKAGFSMHELGVYEADSTTPLPIAAIYDEQAVDARRGNVAQLFDEQQLMIRDHQFKFGSYFDEIYHARTAYEHLEGIKAYESTHPPLGKIIIALGIKLFGLNPFGWRVAGTVIGILMLPIMYIFALRLFRKTPFATIATALFAVDFMHFSQTRIATIDVYGVFFIMLMFYFMHRYFMMNFYRDRFVKTLIPLGLAGLMFGLGFASKWIAAYGGAGLAVMLAISLFARYKEYRAAKRVLKSGINRAEGFKEGMDHFNGSIFEKRELTRVIEKFPKYTIYTLLICLVFYVVVPLAIYMMSYIPVLNAMDSGYTVKAFIDYQKNMFNYHSNLVSTHAFSSSWWEWPFMKRPVWYYSDKYVVEGMKSTIVALGNPIIWWTGLFAVIATIWFSIKRRDKWMYTVWIAYLSQYIPWMLVTRETFLYHYFAMVPFMILSIVYMFTLIEERYPKWKKVKYMYTAGAAILFILFYPALSGLTVPDWYINVLLRWFPSWVF